MFIDQLPATLSVILASIFWAIATQLFAHLGRDMSVTALNVFKAAISFCFFFVFNIFLFGLNLQIETLPWLVISGIVGFGLADILIFYSFSKMGPARTLMLSAFTPSIMALQSYIFLGLSVNRGQWGGLFLMGLCLILLGFDKRKHNENGAEKVLGSRWEFRWRTALIALGGFSLDAFGVILTKKAFILAPTMKSSEANMIRIGSAFFILLFIAWWRKINLREQIKNVKTMQLVFLSSFLGTFLSLLFWVNAIAKGHPPTIAALGGLSPVLATLFEYGKEKRWPSPYFFGALISMGCGIFLLILSL